MKILKKIALPALLCCGVLVAVVSCKDENIETSNSIQKDNNQIAIEKLVALGEKLNPTEKELTEYDTKYKSLSFDELIQFRKIQHENIKLMKGIGSDVEEKLKQDMKWFIKMNKQSISLFGKPLNQASDLQVNEVLTVIEKEKSKKAKVAACPAVAFTTSFTRGFGGSTNLNTISAREVSQPSSPNDCDCQISFGTSNTNFRRIRPLNANATNLLNDFGNSLGGRQLTGASAGSYPVFGKLRVTFRYPGAIFSGCNVLLGQYTLSNN